MARKVIALLLCCMLLGSCSILKESGSAKTPLEIQPVNYKGYMDYYASLYRINENNNRILEYTEVLHIADWKDSPKAVVEAVLSAAQDVGFGHISSKVSVESVTLCDEVANVALRTSIEISDRQRHVLAVLISNALIANCGVNYANVQFNGKSASLAGLPIGLYTKVEGDLSAQYQQQLQQLETLGEAPYYVDLALYMTDPKTDYILSEIRSVNVNVQEPVQLIRDVLWELAKGPRYEMTYKAPLKEAMFSQMLSLYSVEDLGSYFHYSDGIMTMYHGEQLIDCSMLQDAEEEMACIFYTLKGVLPELRYVYAYWNDILILMDEPTAVKYLGDKVSIYLPHENMTSIQEVSRVVHCEESLDWNTYLALIAAGPVETDPDTVVSAFPGGLTAQDVLSLDVSGNCAILNFSSNFTKGMGRLTTQGQVLMVYSIVNTLCAIKPVQTVQILVEGQSVAKLEGSNLSLASSLMANPGLVRQ